MATPGGRSRGGVSHTPYSPYQPGKNTLDGTPSRARTSAGARSTGRYDDRARNSGDSMYSDRSYTADAAAANASSSSRSRLEDRDSSLAFKQLSTQHFYGAQSSSSRSLQDQVSESPTNYRNAALSGRRSYDSNPAMLTRGGAKKIEDAKPVFIDLHDDEDESDVEKTSCVDQPERRGRQSYVGPSRSSTSPTRHSLSPTHIRHAKYNYDEHDRQSGGPAREVSTAVDNGKTFQLAQYGDEEKLRKRMRDRNGNLVATKAPARNSKTHSLVSMSRDTKLSMAKPLAGMTGMKHAADEVPGFELNLDAIVFDKVCKFDQVENCPRLIFKAPNMFALSFMFNNRSILMSISKSEIAERALKTSDNVSSLQGNPKRIFKFELSGDVVTGKLIDELEDDLSLGTFDRLPRSVDVMLFGTTPLEDHRAWRDAMRTVQAQVHRIEDMAQEQIKRFDVQRRVTKSVQDLLSHVRQEADTDKDMSPVVEEAPKVSPQRNSVRPKPRPAVKEAKRIEGVIDESEPETQDEQSEKEASEAQAAAKRAKSSSSDRPKFVYPPSRERGSVALFQTDLDKLKDGEFLNDSIIDFGLKYIFESVKEKDKLLYDQIHIFSSFFYNKLTATRDIQAAYSTVRKWTKGVDVFAKKFLVVPINEKLHWYLAIVVNPLYALPEEHRARYSEAVMERQTQADALAMVATKASNEDVRMDVCEAPVLAGDQDERHNPPCMMGSESPSIPDQREGSVEGTELTQRRFPVKDTRSRETDEEEDVQRGSLHGGGLDDGDLPRKKGTPITPGESFKDDGDELPRSIFAVEKRSDRYGERREKRTSRFSLQDYELSPVRVTRSKSASKFIDLDPVEPLSFAERQRKDEVNRREMLESDCVVLTFDSLAGRHTNVKNNLRKYLQMELKDKFHIETGSDKVWTVAHIAVGAPQQQNLCDCGLFMLHAFSRFFSESGRFVEEVIPSGKAEHDAWKVDERIKDRRWWRNESDRLAKEWETIKQERKGESKSLKRDRDESAAASDTAPTDRDQIETDGGSDRKSARLSKQDTAAEEDGKDRLQERAD